MKPRRVVVQCVAVLAARARDARAGRGGAGEDLEATPGGGDGGGDGLGVVAGALEAPGAVRVAVAVHEEALGAPADAADEVRSCLLYTSDAADE